MNSDKAWEIFDTFVLISIFIWIISLIVSGIKKLFSLGKKKKSYDESR